MTLGGSESDDEEGEEAKKLTQCPACAVKALAQYYWGNGDLNATDEPIALPLINPQLVAIHNVDNVLRMFTPGVGTLDPQEDPEEMQTRLLTACLESVDRTLAVNTAWRTRYEALFILQLETTRRCPCGALQALPPGTNDDDMGFRSIAVLPKGQSDSVAAAIHRKFDPVVLGNFVCNSCNTSRPLTETIRIEGSPEYLRIKLSIVDLKGNKNTNPIVLNEYQDLLQYQAVGGHAPRLKYRLSSVLYHLGDTLSSGHWAASARGPDHVFCINDAHANQQQPSQLRNNPQRGAEAAVLMYKRVHTR